MYRLEEKDIETVSTICNVPNEVAIVALQYARWNIGVAINELKFNNHFIEKSLTFN